jgi:hypothetical protein
MIIIPAEEFHDAPYLLLHCDDAIISPSCIPSSWGKPALKERKKNLDKKANNS